MAVDGTAKTSRHSGTPSLSPFVDRVLAPGDQAIDLHSVEGASDRTGVVLRLGTGLRQDGASVISTRAGVLRATQNQRKFWVESSLKRYTPGLDEEVLGIVVEKHAENFDVDIRGPSLALLPVLSFEGATRRNRPNIEIGAAVYARVTKTHPDAIPEIACIDDVVQSRNTASRPPAVELKETRIERLMDLPRPGALEALGSAVSFEMAVGLNGRVWVKGETIKVTILVASAIQASEGKSSAQQRILVRALLQAFRDGER